MKKIKIKLLDEQNLVEIGGGGLCLCNKWGGAGGMVALPAYNTLEDCKQACCTEPNPSPNYVRQYAFVAGGEREDGFCLGGRSMFIRKVPDYSTLWQVSNQ